MAERERDLGLLWHSFMYELYRATASLMYLLQGMESVRNSELPRYNQARPTHQPYVANFPKLSYVDVPLSLSGIHFDPNDILQREGEAEQLAFKGWVEQIYHCTWESQYRNELKNIFEGKGIIRPQMDPIGDFRRIRNDLIHKSGIASADETGKCTVLKWFDPGDRITLGMRHVFDFLNQMAFMTTMPGYLNHGPSAAWLVFPDMQKTLLERPVPELVSLRTSFDKQLEDGSSWHIVSVVFENGVFVNIPVYYALDSHSMAERTELLNEVCIDDEGNVHFPNGSVKDREILYKEAVTALLGKGPKFDGVGVPGPAIKFRN